MARSARQAVVHFRSKCIGCGACTLVAPEGWVLSEGDGKADLVGAQESGDHFRLVLPRELTGPHREAAEACPVDIIQVG